MGTRTQTTQDDALARLCAAGADVEDEVAAEPAPLGATLGAGAPVRVGQPAGGRSRARQGATSPRTRSRQGRSVGARLSRSEAVRLGRQRWLTGVAPSGGALDPPLAPDHR